MRLRIPNLDFLKGIEQIASEGSRTFIDANTFFSPMYWKKNNTVNLTEIVKVLEFHCPGLDNLRETKNQIRDYKDAYTEGFTGMIKKYPQVTTIKRAISEVHKFISFHTDFMRILREHRRSIKEQFRSNRFHVALDTVKKTASCANRALSILSERYVYPEAALGNLELYNKLVSLMELESLECDVSLNGFKADQHLLANAVYLSALSGEKINIITFDRDLIALLIESHNEIKQITKNYTPPSYSVYRLKFSPDTDRIFIKGKSVKNGEMMRTKIVYR